MARKRKQRRVRGALRVYGRAMASGADWWWCNVPGRGRVALGISCADASSAEAHRIACERFADGSLTTRSAGPQAEATIDEVIAAFGREQRARYKPRTWGSMARRLDALGDWLATEGVTLPSKITDELVSKWIAARQKKKLQNASINRALLAARVCFRWASTREPPLCPTNAFVRTGRLREVTRDKHPVVPSPEEWRRVVAELLNEQLEGRLATAKTGHARARHAANVRGVALLVGAAVETGMRFDELRHQRAADVKAQAVVIAAHGDWSPKSWHERTVPVSKDTADALREMIRWRDGAVGLNGVKLVLGEHWVNERIAAAWARAELAGEPPSMHDARRTFATATVRAGMGLDRVRSLLGHRDVTTTERYVGRYRSDAETPIAALGVLAVMSAETATVIPLERGRR